MLLAQTPSSILRGAHRGGPVRSPGLVVDVGGRLEPELGNFDHHQFPRDADPTCSLSLVLQKLGLYEECPGILSVAGDRGMVRLPGPNDTADWLGIDQDTMGKLNSPIDVTLLQSFAKRTEHHPGEPLWEIMRGIGSELVTYLTTLRSRIDRAAEVEQLWILGYGDDVFRVLFAPRTDPPIEEVSGALGCRSGNWDWRKRWSPWFLSRRSGEGYGMRRYDDSPVLDFSRLEKEPEVHFTHNRGFIAKTGCTDPARLRELLPLGSEQVVVD